MGGGKNYGKVNSTFSPKENLQMQSELYRPTIKGLFSRALSDVTKKGGEHGVNSNPFNAMAIIKRKQGNSELFFYEPQNWGKFIVGRIR